MRLLPALLREMSQLKRHLKWFTVTGDDKVYTATFTPTANVEDTTNIVSVGTGYTDTSGNTGTAASSANYTIDTTAPTVVITMADTALQAGETSLVTFTFDETPTGFTQGDVTVENGTLSGLQSLVMTKFIPRLLHRLPMLRTPLTSSVSELAIPMPPEIPERQIHRPIIR